MSARPRLRAGARAPAPVGAPVYGSLHGPCIDLKPGVLLPTAPIPTSVGGTPPGPSGGNGSCDEGEVYSRNEGTPCPKNEDEAKSELGEESAGMIAAAAANAKAKGDGSKWRRIPDVLGDHWEAWSEFEINEEQTMARRLLDDKTHEYYTATKNSSGVIETFEKMPPMPQPRTLQNGPPSYEFLLEGISLSDDPEEPADVRGHQEEEDATPRARPAPP